MGQYNQVQLDSVAFGDPEGKGWLVGGLIPVGAGEIRLAYSIMELETSVGTPEVQKAAIGYVHNLSKRTAVYTTYAVVKNDGGANFTLNGSTGLANEKSHGLDIGIRHSF
jgi:Gram-negative porin